MLRPSPTVPNLLIWVESASEEDWNGPSDSEIEEMEIDAIIERLEDPDPL